MFTDTSEQRFYWRIPLKSHFNFPYGVRYREVLLQYTLYIYNRGFISPVVIGPRAVAVCNLYRKQRVIVISS